MKPRSRTVNLTETRHLGSGLVPGWADTNLSSSPYRSQVPPKLSCLKALTTLSKEAPTESLQGCHAPLFPESRSLQCPPHQSPDRLTSALSTAVFSSQHWSPRLRSKFPTKCCSRTDPCGAHSRPTVSQNSLLPYIHSPVGPMPHEGRSCHPTRQQLERLVQP